MVAIAYRAVLYPYVSFWLSLI